MKKIGTGIWIQINSSFYRKIFLICKTKVEATEYCINDITKTWFRNKIHHLNILLKKIGIEV